MEVQVTTEAEVEVEVEVEVHQLNSHDQTVTKWQSSPAAGDNRCCSSNSVHISGDESACEDEPKRPLES